MEGAATVRRAMIAHARRENPNECCGFLLGRPREILYAVPMRNVAASRTRYRIDDRAHIALRRALRPIAPALEIVGVYHSHPAGDPVASPTDVAEAMYPEWVHVIIGLRGGRARVQAFRIANGRARALEVSWRAQ
jgi:proteasome lid subunit RPN8/RPN11